MKIEERERENERERERELSLKRLQAVCVCFFGRAAPEALGVRVEGPRGLSNVKSPRARAICAFSLRALLPNIEFP